MNKVAMASRPVETIVNGDEDLRLRIYDGDIPLEAAGAALIARQKRRIAYLEGENAQLRARLTGAMAQFPAEVLRSIWDDWCRNGDGDSVLARHDIPAALKLAPPPNRP